MDYNFYLAFQFSTSLELTFFIKLRATPGSLQGREESGTYFHSILNTSHSLFSALCST